MALDTEFMRQLSQLVRDQQGNINKFFGKSALEMQALDAIAFGITENNTHVWFLAEGYTAICLAIARGDIVVLNKSVPGADAAYDDDRDFLLLPPDLLNTTLGRSKVVHELTHAIVDVAPGTNWTELTNECAAFIAQAIYLKVTKTPVPQYANDVQLTAIHREARALVDSFGFGGNTVGYGGITRADPELEKLRRAVAAVYMHHKWEDQIPSKVFGMRSGAKINTGQRPRP